MDGEIGQPIVPRRLSTARGVCMTTEIVTETPEISRRHGLLPTKPVLMLRLCDRGPVTAGKTNQVVARHNDILRGSRTEILTTGSARVK
jgi:hypothetical protein